MCLLSIIFEFPGAALGSPKSKRCFSTKGGLGLGVGSGWVNGLADIINFSFVRTKGENVGCPLLMDNDDDDAEDFTP